MSVFINHWIIFSPSKQPWRPATSREAEPCFPVLIAHINYRFVLWTSEIRTEIKVARWRPSRINFHLYQIHI